MINVIQHRFEKNVLLPFDLQPAKLIFADPPYNLGVKYADDPTGDAQPDADYFDWCKDVISSTSALLAPGGTFWWLCPESHGDIVGPMLTSIVGNRVGRIVWHETFAQYQQKSLTKDYRFLFCHTNGDVKNVTFFPDAIREPSVRQQIGDKRADPRGRVPGSVWKIRRLQGTSTDRVDWHPCQLPPEMLQRIILGWTNIGDHCIDLFAGSGNFGKVCKRENRKATLIDGSPTYVSKLKDMFK